VFAQYGTPAPPNTAVMEVNTDGTLFPNRFGYNYRGFPGIRVGLQDTIFGWDNATDYTTLSLPLERYTAFARGTYEVTPDIELFAQFNYSTSETSTRGPGPSLFNQPPTVPVTNPFVPADLRAILASRPFPDAPIYYY